VRRLAFAAALLLLAAAGRPAAGAPSPASKVLKEATSAYERSDFTRVIELLTSQLHPRILFTKQEQVIQAYKLLGLSYMFERDRAQAEKQFLAILALRPGFRLDPLVDPVAAVELLEDVKRRNAEKIKVFLERERREAERRRLAELRRQEAARKQDQQPSIERTVTKHPYWINFLPLGAGQFQNGHHTKGYVLLGLQLGLAAVSLGTYLSQYGKYPGNLVPGEEWDQAQALTITQVTTGAACLALVAYGIIDALVYHQPEAVTVRPLKKKSSKTKASFYLAPGPGPSVGLGFTF